MPRTIDQESRSIKRTLDSISSRKKAPIAGFVALLVVYVLTSFLVVRSATSEDVIFIMGAPTPIRTLAGVFSSFGNISIILIVLFYDRLGFITSVAILLFQIPQLLFSMVREGNFTSLPGIFGNIIVLLAVFLIHRNNVQIGSYQQRLMDQAVTDRLTGLPNRFACSELMDDLVLRGETFALASFNLNNFKSVNSTMGPKTGNEVLIEIARRMKETAEQGPTTTLDFVTYQGSDEYGLVIRDFQNETDLWRTIACYESAIEEAITLEDCDFFLTASVGYAVFPTDATDSDTLLSHVEATVQAVKRSRSSERIRRFTPDLLSIEREMEVERKIRSALENDTLYFNLQPQYDMEHRLVGFEALARMRDAEGNFVSPGEFIPVAEKIGLIDQVDLKVLRKSTNFFGELVRQTGTDAVLSVNVSVRHLMKNDFLDEVRDVLATSGVPASQLEIEITESIMIDSAEKALQCIRGIKDMGIKIAIDDFGTGYSSLSYLNSFPADMLKVDKSFIDSMNMSDSSKQYVAAIISIGHVMNFTVISEGVEEPEQLDTLREIGCDYIQGFIWGRPMEAEDAARLVAEAA